MIFLTAFRKIEHRTRLAPWERLFVSFWLLGCADEAITDDAPKLGVGAGEMARVSVSRCQGTLSSRKAHLRDKLHRYTAPMP